MKALVFISLAILLITGCPESRNPESATVAKPVQPACSAYGGFEERVCPVSIYALIANPDAYYGKTLAFNGYVQKSQDGNIFVYPSREIAASGDLASSVICITAKEKCESYVGKYAEVFGVFTGHSEPDFFFKPVGTVRLAYVRSARIPDDH